MLSQTCIIRQNVQAVFFHTVKMDADSYCQAPKTTTTKNISVIKVVHSTHTPRDPPHCSQISFACLNQSYDENQRRQIWHSMSKSAISKLKQDLRDLLEGIYRKVKHLYLAHFIHITGGDE